MTRKDPFDGTPLSRDAVNICIGEEEIKVYGFGTSGQRAATAAQIDPTDPTNIGTSIVEWSGAPKFWGRDRLLVLYLGRDDPTAALLASVLGPPFAQGQGRPALLPDAC